MSKTVKLTRKELYDKVWSTPMIQLAKEFNLSDNGLRKICKNFDIPIPQVGYWQKVQYGKKVMKLPLPKKDTEKEININVEESKNASPTFAIRSVVTEKIRSNSKLILDVSERLTKPDEIVVKTQTDLSKKKPSDSYEKVKGLVSASRGLPSIKVTPKNIPRAMRILDNLIKNFKILGYEVKVKDEGLSIEAYGGDTQINIREKSTATLTPKKYGWNDRELTANGKLAVKVGRYGDYEFVDTEKVLVESQIEKILIKIETEFLKR